ncbi:MAG: hypothetical protein K8R41_02015 [Bacteroidales bacterium]|nr:hypothetical protein [Bacteroidales bacterium]
MKFHSPNKIKNTITKMRVVFRITFLFMFFLVGMSSYSQSGDWVDFQTINTGEETIFDITYNKGTLAVNYDNSVVVIYTIVNDEFTENIAYRIKDVWTEFGTLRFYNNDLYVAIDGFKFYHIKLLSKKIKKTNTYKAGFYITERYYKEFKTLKWNFKITEDGNLKILRNIVVSDNIPE